MFFYITGSKIAETERHDLNALFTAIKESDAFSDWVEFHFGRTNKKFDPYKFV